MPPRQPLPTVELAESVIVFAGPRGAGKTTAIASVSDASVIEAPLRGETGMPQVVDAEADCLVIGHTRLPQAETIHLCGVPDCDLDFAHAALGLPVRGVVVLIAGDALDPVAALERFLDRYARACRDGAVVIGVTRTVPGSSARIVRRLRRRVRHRLGMIPVYEVDVRDRVQVLVLLAALIEMARLRAWS
jgi:signal recognition particle receptor subunit beta